MHASLFPTCPNTRTHAQICLFEALEHLYDWLKLLRFSCGGLESPICAATNLNMSAGQAFIAGSCCPYQRYIASLSAIFPVTHRMFFADQALHEAVVQRPCPLSHQWCCAPRPEGIKLAY